MSPCLKGTRWHFKGKAHFLSCRLEEKIDSNVWCIWSYSQRVIHCGKCKKKKKKYLWKNIIIYITMNTLLLQPHLFLLEISVSQTARTCGLPRTQSPPVWRRCGSCCSWGWWWPRSWGSAAAWGRIHSGTRSCARGWSPGHQWVLLLLYPYIGHSPFSPLCGREGERQRRDRYGINTQVK